MSRTICVITSPRAKYGLLRQRMHGIYDDAQFELPECDTLSIAALASGASQ